MPLDPSIILAGKPAPIENPIQMYEQAVALRGQQQQQAQSAGMYPIQQQTAQAQSQQAQLQAQQMQIQVDQQKKLSQAWADTMSPTSSTADQPTPSTPPSVPAPPPVSAPPQSAAILDSPVAPPSGDMTDSLAPAPATSPAPVGPAPATDAGDFLGAPQQAPAQPTAAPPRIVAAPAAPPQTAPPAAPSIGPATDRLQAFYNRALQNGVMPQTLQPIQKAFLETQQGYARLGAEQLENDIKRHSLINGSLMGTFSTTDPTTGEQVWNQPTSQEWRDWVKNAAVQDHLTAQDVIAIQQKHPDGSPPTPQELEVYSHTLYTDITLKQSAKEQLGIQDATAKLTEAQSKAQDALRTDAVNSLYQASNYGDFATRRAAVLAKYPDLAPTLPAFAGRDPVAPLSAPDRQAINEAAVTPEQRNSLAQQQAALQQRASYQSAALDLRGAIADQNAALRQTALDLRTQGKGSKLTPAQIATQEGNITKNESALNAERLELGATLGKGKDPKGVALYNSDGTLTDDGVNVKARFEAATDALQKQQFRRADLYGIGKPDPQDVQTAQNGESIAADDGSIWVKKGGVAFHTGAANATQAAAPPPSSAARAPQPAATPKPATPATPAPQKMTEAQARAKAIGAGKNPDWYVTEARKRGWIQ